MMQISLSEHEDGLVDNSIPKPKKQQVTLKNTAKFCYTTEIVRNEISYIFVPIGSLVYECRSNQGLIPELVYFSFREKLFTRKKIESLWFLVRT